MTDYKPHYTQSHALVMGVDAYKHFPPLYAAVKGAEDLAAVLRDRYRFNVTCLVNEQVKRNAVLGWLNRISLEAKPNDRVLIYFAGHGMTRGAGARERGYLALSDSEPDQWHTALAMDDVTDEAGFVKAKHLLYLLDCCFGGLALQVRAVVGAPRELDYFLTRQVRYAISAGGREVVDDSLAPDGEHSLFTYHLLEWLTNDRLVPPGGIWRARELGNFLERAVAHDRRSGHKPNHNYLAGSGDGDFIFNWRIGPRLATDVEAAMHAHSMHIRRGAVEALFEIVQSDDPNQVTYAREWLGRLAETDPDEQVRDMAQRFLEGESEEPSDDLTPLIPRAELVAADAYLGVTPGDREVLPADSVPSVVGEMPPMVSSESIPQPSVAPAKEKTPFLRRWWRLAVMLLAVIILILFEVSIEGYLYIEYVYELANDYEHNVHFVAALPVALVSLSHFFRGHWLRGIACLLGTLSVGFVSFFKLMGWYGGAVDWIWDDRWPLCIPVGLLLVWAFVDAIIDEGV